MYILLTGHDTECLRFDGALLPLGAHPFQTVEVLHTVVHQAPNYLGHTLVVGFGAVCFGQGQSLQIDETFLLVL